MGLSTNLVSIDDHELDNWTSSSRNSLPEPPLIRRQPPPKPEPLKCPRCDSTNTKFCYYNNYNKSQPRHYCKGCKRHWTEGGTLRNVPVGGGRKNKRLRPTIDHVDHITERKHIKLDLQVNNQRCPLISTMKTTTSHMPSVTIRGNGTIVSTMMNEDVKKENDRIFYETLNLPSSMKLSSNISLRFSEAGERKEELIDQLEQIHNLLPSVLNEGIKAEDGNTHFSLIDDSSYTTQLSSNVHYNEYMGKFDSTLMEESTITTVMPISHDQPWKVPETSNDLINHDNNMSSNYWNNWNEFDTWSTAADLNISWDDLEIKP